MWGDKWAAQGWYVKPKKKRSANYRLVRAVWEESRAKGVEVLHVRGHSGNKWNELADRLATREAQTAKAERPMAAGLSA